MSDVGSRQEDQAGQQAHLESRQRSQWRPCSLADVVQVAPFDSALKYMASVIKLGDGEYRAYVKGTSETLLKKKKKKTAPRSFADPEFYRFDNSLCP